MRLDCMLWIQTGACCLTAAELCWLSRNVGITLGSNNLENSGNLRMMLEHCVGVCLEKRTFRLHVSADHEKKYSRQAEKVKAPRLCWHRLQLISLCWHKCPDQRNTPCASLSAPWMLHMATPCHSHPLFANIFYSLKPASVLATEDLSYLPVTFVLPLDVIVIHFTQTVAI